jgi:DNA polymerase-1
MMPNYPGLGLDNALVILDWSGWVRRAWHASGLQVDKTAGIVAGWLARMLSDPMPSAIVAACDPPRRKHTGFRVPTWRHYSTRSLDESKQYKAGRPPATEELMACEDALDELLRLHAIPVLRPDDPTSEQNWEADDAAATAVRLARFSGRPCVLVSIDKDWMQLVSTEDPMRPMVLCWDPQHDVITDEKAVLSRWSVEPDKILDLFALMGDKGDNVPGVHGIGQKKAAELIWSYGSLDGAIEASKDEATRAANRPLRLLFEQQNEALLSRSLIRLWDNAPIDWHAQSQYVGGFDVRGLRKLYRDFGHTLLAESIPTFSKRDPSTESVHY